MIQYSRRGPSIPFVLTMAVLVGCSSETAPVSGKIVFSESRNLDVYTFPSTEPDRVYSGDLIKNSPAIMAISKVDSRRVLVDLGGRISEFDLQQKKWKQLGAGRNPYFVGEHGIVFEKYLPEQDRDGLFVVPYAFPMETATEIAPEIRLTHEGVIVISGDEILIKAYFAKHSDYQPVALLYNFTTQELKELPSLEGCSPTIWRSKTRQILCNMLNENGAESGQYRLMSLDGSNVQDVSLFKHERPYVYIAEKDMMLFDSPRVDWFPFPSEPHDLWFYDFSSQERKRILKETTYFNPGLLVWLGQ